MTRRGTSGSCSRSPQPARLRVHGSNHWVPGATQLSLQGRTLGASTEGPTLATCAAGSSAGPDPKKALIAPSHLATAWSAPATTGVRAPDGRRRRDGERVCKQPAASGSIVRCRANHRSKRPGSHRNPPEQRMRPADGDRRVLRTSVPSKACRGVSAGRGGGTRLTSEIDRLLTPSRRLAPYPRCARATRREDARLAGFFADIIEHIGTAGRPLRRTYAGELSRYRPPATGTRRPPRDQ